MSMMDVLIDIRRKAKSTLPWQCVLIQGRCRHPKKDCVDCRIYKNYREAFNHDTKNAGNTK